MDILKARAANALCSITHRGVVESVPARPVPWLGKPLVGANGVTPGANCPARSGSIGRSDAIPGGCIDGPDSDARTTLPVNDCLNRFLVPGREQLGTTALHGDPLWHDSPCREPLFDRWILNPRAISHRGTTTLSQSEGGLVGYGVSGRRFFSLSQCLRESLTHPNACVLVYIVKAWECG